EVMFMAWVGVAEEKMNIQHFLKREGSDNITAVQENELYTLEESLYCRPSPRLLLGLKKLAALLHPSVFPKDDGIDPLR
ncbi:MAG TPA: cobalamin-binding protein, partial [Massilibacterium sp.]|nr:cobalamin-binding protein [Massilibacterium sp.]